MNLPDLKDLAKVIDLCRKKGVSSITLGDMRLEFGNEPERRPSKSPIGDEIPAVDPSDPWANFPAGNLTPEQLTYYSAGGVPGQEPWMNKGGEE
jgi:hypothetical protein